MSNRLKNWLTKVNKIEVKLKTFPNIIKYGILVSSIGLIVEVIGLKLPIGAVCIIESKINNKTFEIEAEVVGFKNKKLLLMLLNEPIVMAPGLKVFPKIDSSGIVLDKKLPIGKKLLGRILDGNGQPVDKLGKLKYEFLSSLSSTTINPLERKPITNILDPGIRAINGLLTLGKGQKIGIFATAGVGKSILLEMMMRSINVDVIVIGLIGERSREIKECIEVICKENNFFRSIVIIAPSNVSPILRIQATLYASKIAEYFRSQNKDVLLVIDSLTRYAMAQREVSLAIGEFPISKGYASSIYSQLPLLIERAGNGVKKNESISAFYTILTEQNEFNDPISDIARSVLDGHIVLSKQYADSGHFPAIDIEKSVSRVMHRLVDKNHYTQSLHFKKLVACYQRNKDLINMGAYISGTDFVLDESIRLWPQLIKFLQQNFFENIFYKKSYEELKNIFNEN
ncbi:flagellum-specific ATP synthase [Buchnera aphidicola (Nipponaphis monzeni)]|uniref:Flagellum-specific ATP synthase n=1 Tax=Buchnera aphidicola (Nipponaphis monzeni) TaxID=2495405 RepID=A0A455T9Q6_9GAMM|nr:FliI/YscN family ATPase [Buchnera aphidicola]BBI01077.1 flagellum-specific ATP synthase [Buchnera aphidicola (Nipponaphis monzeni)]